MEKNHKNVEVHEESGLQFYKIKLLGEGENAIYLRLFESFSPGRLKWKNDEETRDEYLVRRKYMNEAEKQRSKGTLVWNSSLWGSVTTENLLRVQSELNSGKHPEEIIKL